MDDFELEKLLCEIPHENYLNIPSPHSPYHDNNFNFHFHDDECKNHNHAFKSSPVTANGFPDSASSSFSSGASPPQFEVPRPINPGFRVGPNDQSIFSWNFRDVIQHYDQSPSGDVGRYDKCYRNDLLSNIMINPKSSFECNLLGSGPQLYRANNSCYQMKFMLPITSPDNPPVNNPVFYPSPTLIGSSYSSAMQHYNDRNLIHSHQSVANRRNKVTVEREDNLIIQRGDIDHRTTRNPRSRGHNARSFHQENNGGWKSTQDKRSQLNGIHYPLNRPWKFNSLSEARGYMYHMAKDQQGCRFLQRMFVEGTSRDVQIIFNEIIGHAVELMMTPFGNYLMQKLLEVCSEEQKMHILFRVTDEPGELVRISLNKYGTRVVQKLVETLNTKQQISMVISALEPGFLALMKDLNGSHLIKKCLQCFPSEDSKFIFVAAAKYCVDIATHQNGCCALQSCIKHSTGEHREIFFAEISANGLLLAEDAYGNYVVQFILELQIPYATSKLTSQFEGNYVNLSTQKFSSHVVENCLLLCNEEARAKIIHELLSSSCFEQLLQDPYANYVIQTALRVSEGHVHYSLVDAIESYKAVSRNSPYSKKIFSQKFSKR